ncbi:replication initiation and membrane attachment family protein [Latilactobacillus fuchuensis]|uniref:DnaB protein n=1 Tax=Latilactobacillus fuchuensis DSM 14340 = JCM 11249 TaxID=1423747 RepID=A0A0R1RWB4_9LACO|nr:DnaD domain protein [Latilactobacillus fuchuensis]KRL61360.1 dnaB protein [Latilactobacillus fuchuensis DSM 14340 = JCM 11249]
MADAFDFLSPKDGFLVTKANYLTDFDQTVVTYLYQPLMGAVAYSLYLLLWSQVKDVASQHQFQTHATLLNLLSVDLPAFYDGRSKLEALGLIRTYQKNGEAGRQLVYELYAPMKPDVFFKDDLLSVVLYESVGEKRFIELRERFKLQPVRSQDYKEVSKNFLTVFHVQNDHLLNTPDGVAETKSLYQQKSPNKPSFSALELQTFDWELLQDVLGQRQISPDEVLRNEQRLFNLHYFYGLDEITLANLMGTTMDARDNTLNMEALEQNVLGNYTRRHAAQNKVATDSKYTLSELQKQGQQAKFNEQEMQWLTDSQRYLPVDYLNDLKQKKHGYVAKNEIRALKDLQGRYIFSNDVLNILVAYITERYEGLTQALLDRIANQWAQKGVQTPVDAIQQIRQFQTAQTDKAKTKQNNRYQTKPTKQETVPKWAQPDYQAPKETTTKADQNQVDQLLKKIREGRGE